MAAAGPSAFITRTCSEIDAALISAFNQGADLLRVHKSLIEEKLRFMHATYSENLYSQSMEMLVVFSDRAAGASPLLYRSELSMLIPVPFYASAGAGKDLANYLADRLYDWERIDNVQLIALAAFIFREVADSVDGVGLGVDLKFIKEGNSLALTIGSDLIQELQRQFPPLNEAVFSYWKDRVFVPKGMIP